MHRRLYGGSYPPRIKGVSESHMLCGNRLLLKKLEKLGYSVFQNIEGGEPY